jgi:hypothetical protein
VPDIFGNPDSTNAADWYDLAHRALILALRSLSDDARYRLMGPVSSDRLYNAARAVGPTDWSAAHVLRAIAKRLRILEGRP